MKRIMALLLTIVLLGSSVPVAYTSAEQFEGTNERYWINAIANDPERSTQIDSSFIYSDSYLLGDEYEVNPGLARASVALAQAAYERNGSTSVEEIAEQMGFHMEHRSYPTYTLKDNDKVGFSIYAKQIKEYKVYLLVIQGTTASYDWLSNFNIYKEYGSNLSKKPLTLNPGIGDLSKETIITLTDIIKVDKDGDEIYEYGLNTTGVHYGFSTAANQVLEVLADLIQNDNSSGKRMIWLTGHSRGAAVSNYIASILTTFGKEKFNKVFAYNFACPKPFMKECSFYTKSTNIINYVNYDDIVPEMPLEEKWGFGRSGQDIVLGEQNVLPLNTFSKAVQKIKKIAGQLMPDRTSAQTKSARLLLSLIAAGVSQDAFTMDKAAIYAVGVENYENWSKFFRGEIGTPAQRIKVATKLSQVLEGEEDPSIWMIAFLFFTTMIEENDYDTILELLDTTIQLGRVIIPALLVLSRMVLGFQDIIPGVNFASMGTFHMGSTYIERIKKLYPQDEYEIETPAIVQPNPVDGDITTDPTNKPSISTHNSFSKGKTVVMGHYEQDNNTQNGEEPIEWIVLQEKNGKALVVSSKSLDCMQYTSTDNYFGITWENSLVRIWLNDSFYKSAFSKDERKVILKTQVDNSAAQMDPYDDVYGKNTEDYIFLLSYRQAIDLFSSDSDRVCTPTYYASAKLGKMGLDTQNIWRLRSAVQPNGATSVVEEDGSVSSMYAFFPEYMIRPAMWISLKTQSNSTDTPPTVTNEPTSGWTCPVCGTKWQATDDFCGIDATPRSASAATAAPATGNMVTVKGNPSTRNGPSEEYEASQITGLDGQQVKLVMKSGKWFCVELKRHGSKVRTWINQNWLILTDTQAKNIKELPPNAIYTGTIKLNTIVYTGPGRDYSHMDVYYYTDEAYVYVYKEENGFALAKVFFGPSMMDFCWVQTSDIIR